MKIGGKSDFGCVWCFAPARLSDGRCSCSCDARHDPRTWLTAEEIVASVCDVVLQKKALRMVKLSHRSGLNVWREFQPEFEARMSNIFTALLRFILNLAMQWSDDTVRGIDFFQSLTPREAGGKVCGTWVSAWIRRLGGGAKSHGVRVR